MENSFNNIISQSKSVLVLLPTNPYFDQVAAGLSLYLALREKVDISVVSPSPMTVEFNRLVGINKVSQDFGNKNLVIRFTDYKADDIERVSYDIENRQFKLTVIPKQGVNAPNKDQVDLSYSGLASDTVILIGGANENHFPALSSKDMANARLVHLGIKQLSLSADKQVVSLASSASSVSELVARYLKANEISLDSDIATNLLMGIEENTKGFSTESVTADTFQVVSELMRLGGKRQSGNLPQQGQFPPGSIPGKPIVQKTDEKKTDETKKEKKAVGQGVPQEWLKPKILRGGQNDKNDNSPGKTSSKDVQSSVSRK
ncbi:MAG: hypothetical protein PVJ52_00400 [Candidatus Woesebacteria bacterium]|jgi:hypothetical protein